MENSKTNSYPFNDSTLTIEERVEDLVSRLDLHEKVSQMLHSAPAIPRLGIPAYNWWNECLHGVARAGTATVFPQAIAMAATFSTDLIKQAGDVISDEARARYFAFKEKEDFGIYKGLTFWTPNINIFRDPRWGRGHETYGEDPYLTSRLGVTFVNALQGNDDNEDKMKIAACAKHYAVHSGPESLRHSFNAVANKQDLEETYLPAFEALVKEAKVESVMGAYNRTNGEPCCGSKTLLQDILRDRYGFDGHVVSDCWAIKDFHENHKITKTPAQSAAMAVKNGADLNCGCTFSALLEAIEEGLITTQDLDISLKRLFTTRMRLGMFDPDETISYSQIPFSKNDSKEHHQISANISERGIVLLKNDGILPLDKNKIKTIAIIGPNADDRECLLGNYNGTPSRYKTVLEGFRDLLDEDTRILYAKGCHVTNEREEGLGEYADRLQEARIIAQMADICIVVTGLNANIEGEQGDAGNLDASGDKIDLNLPGLQNELVKSIYSINENTILVNISGSAIALNDADENCKGIIQAFYPGPIGGISIAKTILGLNNPSGRLPVTFYRSIDDVPSFTDYSMNERTYKFFTKKPLYSFGYGLSYSKFEYSDIDSSIEENFVSFTTKITNISEIDGYEVCELYIKDLESSQRIPQFKLAAFESIYLKSKETKDISFKIPIESFFVIDKEGNKYLEPGEFEIYINGFLPDERTIELTNCKVNKTRIAL